MLDFGKWVRRGEPVAMVRVSFLVDDGVLTCAVAAVMDENDGELVTHRAVEAAIRDRAKWRGEDGLTFWSDDLDDDVMIEAQEVARGLFPGVFG